MSNGTGPDSFRDSNGNHDWGSLNNAGNWEAQRNLPMTPQQHNESSVEFGIRQNAYDWARNNGNGS